MQKGGKSVREKKKRPVDYANVFRLEQISNRKTIANKANNEYKYLKKKKKKSPHTHEAKLF